MAREKFTCEQVARVALGEPSKRTRTELLWRCPNHDDKHESLFINPQKNVFLCAPCNGGGTAWQLAAFLARLDPSNKPDVKAWLNEHRLLNSNGRDKAMAANGQFTAEYVYRDLNRNPVARKLRFEPGKDGRKKDFAWERWDNGAWKSGLAGLKLPLYRLPEVQNEPTVILTEGEKDTDAGAKIGLPATTSGGVNSFREDHIETLRGKHVVIVADADEAGREHAERVAVMLHGQAASVKVCEIPGSKDLAEAIERGLPVTVIQAFFEETPGWTPTEGRAILQSIMRFIRRFVALTESQARIAALWTAHTHAMDAADCTPYLGINSAEKQSGKTRFLEVEKVLVANPWFTGRATAAVLIRKIDAQSPCLLLDESDTAFGGEKEYAETLRGILNAGYKRGGTASCCIGQGANISYKDFSTFCPKAIAGIGRLPDTVADRSIPIRLKREPRRTVERFRERNAEAEAAPIKSRLGGWLKASIESLRDARPEIPSSLSDRQADCCEPLLAIADLAGGEWPKAARRALVELCTESEAGDQSTGVQLLNDIRDIFAERGEDRIASAELAAALTRIETSPWAEWSRGKALSAAKLARILSRYGIAPGTIRLNDETAKGYYKSGFEDAFSRYLPPQKGNNVTRPINIGENAGFENVTTGSCDGTENAENRNPTAGCDGVTDSKVPVSRMREPGEDDTEVL